MSAWASRCAGACLWSSLPGGGPRVLETDQREQFVDPILKRPSAEQADPPEETQGFLAVRYL